MKITRSLFLAFALLCTLNPLVAQKEETVVGNRGLGFSGIWGGSRHQLTQFGNNGKTSYVAGGFFGFEFGKALLVGWGHNSLMDEFKWDDIEDQQFDMRWNRWMLGYGFKNYKAVHPQIGVDFGRGRVELGEVSDRIFVVQPSAGLEINVFRWFHIGVDGGYRFVNDSSIPGLSNQDLSGWFGQASLKFGFSWGRYHKKNKDSKPKRYED
ncbi:MAG: hypothetical protein ACKVT2_18490 [Saprospiraceae bacterium]